MRRASALLLRSAWRAAATPLAVPQPASAPPRRWCSWSTADPTLQVQSTDVFVNQEIDLNSLEWVGFDMDYTLSSYKPALGTLIYELAKEHLVSAKQYPPSLSSLRYDPDFAVRGVAFDTRRGNLLKLDFLHTVSAAFFGRRELSRAEVVAAYGSLVVKGAELAAFRPMVDLFCLPEACLISDVIQQFVDRGVSFHPSYVYSDVKAAVGHLHTSGVLHDAVAASPAQYIDDCPRLVELLRGLHGAGKRTFLLTNSGFRFVAPVMSHLTRADLPPGGWLDLFDFVGVSADKPAWYLEDRPFRSLNPATGKLRWVPVEAVLPGQPYAGGSFAELNRLTGGALAGAGVFYLGDHVFSDLARPSRVGWRTGAIIHELEREVALQTSQPYRELLQGLQAVEHALRRGRHPEGDLALKVLFNPHFGSVFRSHSGPTLFTQSVLRYCDCYTSSVANLLRLSPTATLYPARRALPHEPPVPPPQPPEAPEEPD